MSFEVEGKLFKKFDTAQVTNTFKKREFVVEIDGAYPQFVSFQLTQDRCGVLDTHKETDRIKVSFDLRGREWTSPKGEVKYFNSLNAWKIDAASVVAEAETPAAPTEEGAFPAASEEQSFDDNDDLPF
ncbi:MAG: single-strand DNA-binding protein [Maribacter sp.]|jgi:single-strand DNA-binding protein